MNQVPYGVEIWKLSEVENLVLLSLIQIYVLLNLKTSWRIFPDQLFTLKSTISVPKLSFLAKISFIVGHCGTNTRIHFKKLFCNSSNSYPDIGGPGQHEIWVGIFLFNPPATIVHVGILYSVQNNCSSRHFGHCSGLGQRQNARNLDVAVTYIPEKTQGSQAHEQV